MLKQLISFAAMLGALPAAAQPRCTVANAHYEMKGHPEFSAGFKRLPTDAHWKNDVAIYFHSTQSNQTYWFSFDEGSARYINLISTSDPTNKDWRIPDHSSPRPLGEMHYLSADDGLNFSLSLPSGSEFPPKYILLPDLANTMWYSGSPRESVPIAFFVLKGCTEK